MHGCGNDFMVIDSVTQNVYLSPEKIKQLADRHFGIGFDQLLLVEPPYDPEQDFHYRIFNADGSEVEQCGILANQHWQHSSSFFSKECNKFRI